jgi:hypothetical protein
MTYKDGVGRCCSFLRPHYLPAKKETGIIKFFRALSRVKWLNGEKKKKKKNFSNTISVLFLTSSGC